MQIFVLLRLSGVRMLLMFACMASCHQALAHDASAQPSVAKTPVPGISVLGQLPAAESGVVDLKFHDMFKLPVGPRGLEPSEKLLSLDGKKVRIVGYMVRDETAPAGLFILTPLPVSIGDEDESFADDMPANAIFVHLADASQKAVYIPGLINLNGILSLGNRDEADGRTSYLRLQLDTALSHKLVAQQQASN